MASKFAFSLAKQRTYNSHLSHSILCAVLCANMHRISTMNICSQKFASIEIYCWMHFGNVSLNCETAYNLHTRSHLPRICMLRFFFFYVCLSKHLSLENSTQIIDLLYTRDIENTSNVVNVFFWFFYSKISRINAMRTDQK